MKLVGKWFTIRNGEYAKVLNVNDNGTFEVLVVYSYDVPYGVTLTQVTQSEMKIMFDKNTDSILKSVLSEDDKENLQFAFRKINEIAGYCHAEAL